MKNLKLEIIEYIALNKCGSILELNEERLKILLKENIFKLKLQYLFNNPFDIDFSINEYILWLKKIGKEYN